MRAGNKTESFCSSNRTNSYISKTLSINKHTLTRLGSNKAVLHYDDDGAEGTVNKATLLAFQKEGEMSSP